MVQACRCPSQHPSFAQPSTPEHDLGQYYVVTAYLRRAEPVSITFASIFISSSASLARAAMLSGTGGFSSNCLSVACFIKASATCRTSCQIRSDKISLAQDTTERSIHQTQAHSQLKHDSNVNSPDQEFVPGSKHLKTLSRSHHRCRSSISDEANCCHQSNQNNAKHQGKLDTTPLRPSNRRAVILHVSRRGNQYSVPFPARKDFQNNANGQTTISAYRASSLFLCKYVNDSIYKMKRQSLSNESRL